MGRNCQKIDPTEEEKKQKKQNKMKQKTELRLRKY